MFKSTILIFALFSIVLTTSFFDSQSPVINLNLQQFEEKVMKSREIWLILFYNPDKEESKVLKPEYEKAALAMKNIFKFGASNILEEKLFKVKYKFDSSPTMKFFGINKEEAPQDFTSPPKARSIIENVILKAQSIAKNRLNIKDDAAILYEVEHNPNIVVLNDNNLNDIISKNELMWLVAIYSPKCGVCKKLLPEWVKAAETLKGKAVFAIIDGTVNRQTASRFSIKGYPTIKTFTPGFGRMKKIESYDGPRDADGIVQYILHKLETYMYVKEPPQITNQNVLNDECVLKDGFCIISLFPNIMKSKASERNNFIYEIKKVAKNYKFKPVHFVWAEEGNFYKFEKNNKINKYPVSIGVDFKNKKYSIHTFKTNFDEFSLEGFAKSLLEKRESLNEYNGGLEISEVAEWDRKDYMNEDL